MKITIILSILSTIAAKYPPVQTWGIPELEQTLTAATNFDTNKMQCLSLAYSAFLAGMIDGHDEVKIALKEEDTLAVVPSPQDMNTWTLEELNDAAIIIINNMAGKQVHEYHKRLTVNEVEIAIKKLAPTNLGRFKTTESLINMNILQVLHSILVDIADNNFKVNMDGYRLVMPVIDVSMWRFNVLQRTIHSSNTEVKLTPFLDEALNGVFAKDAKLRDGMICVITPVNVMPQKDRHYYLPTRTKRLLQKARDIGKRRVSFL